MQQRQRNHVARQALTQGLAQRLDGLRPVGHEPGQQAVAAHQHHGLAHPGLGCQRRFDFAGLDAHAANLYLVVVAPQVVQGTVRIPAHQVAAAVQARAWPLAERIGDEALLGQLRAVEVAAGHACPADVQLARHALRHQLALRVQHIHAGVGDGTADVQGAAYAQRAGGGDHGGFGGAVVVDDGKAWVTVKLAQAVAADQQAAQRRVLMRPRQGLLGHRRGQEAHRQRLLQPPVQQFIDMLVADGRRWQVQHRPGAQGRPGFPGHGIKAKSGNAAGVAARPQREGLAMPVHQVGQGAVLHHHALGLAGGPRGIDHIG